MLTTRVASIFKGRPPVAFTLGVRILDRRGHPESSEWFSVSQEGVVAKAPEPGNDDEKLVVSAKRDVLAGIKKGGPKKIRACAEDLAFDIQGDFRIYVRYLRQVVQLLQAMASAA